MDIRRGSRLEAITQGQCWAGDNAINKSALIDTDEKWPSEGKKQGSYTYARGSRENMGQVDLRRLRLSIRWLPEAAASSPSCA